MVIVVRKTEKECKKMMLTYRLPLSFLLNFIPKCQFSCNDSATTTTKIGKWIKNQNAHNHLIIDKICFTVSTFIFSLFVKIFFYTINDIRIHIKHIIQLSENVRIFTVHSIHSENFLFTYLFYFSTIYKKKYFISFFKCVFLFFICFFLSIFFFINAKRGIYIAAYGTELTIRI